MIKTTRYFLPSAIITLIGLTLFFSGSTASSQQFRTDTSEAELLRERPSDLQAISPLRPDGPNSLSIPEPLSVLLIKKCCSNGSCINVPSNTTSCGHFQTARTCDDDGQNCKDHDTPDFPDD